MKGKLGLSRGYIIVLNRGIESLYNTFLSSLLRTSKLEQASKLKDTADGTCGALLEQASKLKDAADERLNQVS